MSDRSMPSISPDVLKKLRCPVSGTPLAAVDGWLCSIDSTSPLRYPIRDGIVVLLAEYAEVMSPAEHEQAMALAGLAGTRVERQEHSADDYNTG